MWKRINYAEWIDLVPVVAFIITFTVFLILVTRTMLMKKSRISHLASLPLEKSSSALTGRDIKAKGK